MHYRGAIDCVSRTLRHEGLIAFMSGTNAEFSCRVGSLASWFLFAFLPRRGGRRRNRHLTFAFFLSWPRMHERIDTCVAVSCLYPFLCACLCPPSPPPRHPLSLLQPRRGAMRRVWCQCVHEAPVAQPRREPRVPVWKDTGRRRLGGGERACHDSYRAHQDPAASAEPRIAGGAAVSRPDRLHAEDRSRRRAAGAVQVRRRAWGEARCDAMRCDAMRLLLSLSLSLSLSLFAEDSRPLSFRTSPLFPCAFARTTRFWTPW